MRCMPAHRDVMKMGRRRVAKVSGMLYDESILSSENVWVGSAGDLLDFS